MLARNAPLSSSTDCNAYVPAVWKLPRPPPGVRVRMAQDVPVTWTSPAVLPSVRYMRIRADSGDDWIADALAPFSWYVRMSDAENAVCISPPVLPSARKVRRNDSSGLACTMEDPPDLDCPP